ncbi:maleylpyruvate isomerase N-terminal domain-containing protein [Streptomyces sp. NPDC002587]
MSGLSEAEWNLTTRCTPWNVLDLLGHASSHESWKSPSTALTWLMRSDANPG